MLGIIRLQLFRLKKSVLFWVFLGLCAGLTVLSALMLVGINALFNQAELGSILETLRLTTSTVSIVSSYATFSTDAALFAMLCTSIVLSKEFSQGTVRNAIVANKSRTQVFFAFFATALIVGASYFVTSFVVSIAVYAPMLGFGTLTTERAVTSVFCCFAMGLGSVLFTQSVVCMFLFGSRKQSTVIALPLVICFVAVNVFAGIIEAIVTSVQLTGKVVSETLLQCLPIYNLTVLNTEEPGGLTVGMIILYDLLFSALFLVLGYFSFKKADLK